MRVLSGDGPHDQAAPASLEGGAQTERRSNRIIARSAILVSAFFGVDKLAGLIRDAVISRTFGTSGELDAYYAAFEVPDALFNVVAGLALATTLIPVLSAYTERKDREGAWRLASVVINWAFLIVGFASLCAAVFAPQLIRAVAPGFGHERAHLATRLMRLVLLQTVISSISGILMSVLQAHQHFLLPAAAPLAYTVGRIGGALWFAPQWGIFGLAWGGLMGTVGHLLIQLPGLVHYKARWTPALHHPELVSMLKLMAPRMLGVGITYLNFVLPTFWGSRLPSGAIATYEYGWRLMQFPETIIGTALGLTVFPTLAQRANAQDRTGLRETAGWALRLVLGLAIPAAVGLLVLGGPLTALFLEGGEFDANATSRVVSGLQAFAFGLITHSALEVASRLFYAQRDMWHPLGAAIAGLLANALLGWILLHPLEHAGLALANGIGAGVQVVLLLLVSKRRLGDLGTRKLIDSLTRTVTVASLMGLAIVALNILTPNVSTLVRSALGVTTGILVFTGTTALFGADEVRELPSILIAPRTLRSTTS